MKQLLFLALTLIIFVVQAYTQNSREIIIETEQVYQPPEQCDSLRFHVTATDHNTGTITVIPQLRHITTVISSDTFYVTTPIDNDYYTFTIGIPLGTFGSHNCVVITENSASETGTTNVKDIDIDACNTGIDDNKPTWCTAVLAGEQLNIVLQNETATLISIIDMNGKVISTAKIYNSTILPFIVPPGIYCVVIEQSDQRKTFKFAKQ